MKEFRVVGVGELLWDLLPSGPQLGGATANFAYQAHVLGAEAWVVSRVGSDALGRDIVARLGELGLPTAGVQLDRDAPTGTVTVEMLAGGGHRFTIHEGVAWDRIAATDDAIGLAAQADAVCFGTLAQRCEESRAAVRAIVAAAPPDALRVFDINLRQHFFSHEVIEESLGIANVLKINDEELPVLKEMLGLAGDAPALLEALAVRFDLKLVALTRGAHGSRLSASGAISELPGSRVEVVDTIGAGDAFTAAMAVGYLAGWDLDTINQRANAVASFVCTRPGATPLLPPDLTAPFADRARTDL